MSQQWIRYQVRVNNTTGPQKFTPHFARNRDTGVENYDPRNLESAKEYAETLGQGAYVVEVTESVVAQY